MWQCVQPMCNQAYEPKRWAKQIACSSLQFDDFTQGISAEQLVCGKSTVQA